MGCSFAHFEGRGSFPVDFLESLHILGTNPSASYRYSMCLRHSACLFLVRSFDDQKFLILMSSNLSIFPFIGTAFGIFLKNVWLPRGYEDTLCCLIDELLFRFNSHI